MSSDKHILIAFITAMEKISQKIDYELSNLKKKINYSDTQELKDFHIGFLKSVIEPIFETKNIIKYEDIENHIKQDKDIKNYSPITIRSYLTALKKGKKIEKISRGQYKQLT